MHVFLPGLIIVALVASAAVHVAAGESTRGPVHPRRNLESFPAVQARFVRFTILRTNRGEPCLDEWEIYGPDDPTANLALADAGTRVTASGTLPDYRIHTLRHVNDGVHGNSHSWICDQPTGWVQVEFPVARPINRMVWSRDRLGKFTDRLPTDYRIEVASEPGMWRLVASSADRPRLETPEALQTNTFTEVPFDASSEPPPPSGPAGREYVFETWRSSQGLPGNRVTAIAQTTDGWLWVGTMNGLARFDGKRFRSMTDRDGLRGAHVTALHVGSDGILQVATDAGVAAWRKGRFEFVANLPGDQELIVALAEDPDGILWAATSGGLCALEGGRFHRKLEGPISHLARHPSEQTLWFIRDSRLQRWIRGRAALVNEDEEPSQFGSLRTFAFGSDAAVWFGGANEYLGKYANDTVTTHAEGHAIFTTVLQEILCATNGDLWIGAAGSGLARVRGEHVLSIGAEDGLLSNHVVALFEDRENNIWVGGNDGLTRIAPRRCEAITVHDGLSHTVVTSLAQDSSGTLWIGTNGGGLNRWNGERAEFFSPSYILDNEVVRSLHATSDGALWMAGTRAGVVRLREAEVSFCELPRAVGRSSIAVLGGDRAGRIWAGTAKGLVLFSADTKSSEPTSQLEGERITALAFDPAGTAWVGTVNGIVALPPGGKPRHWPGRGSSGADLVRALCVGDDGAIWVATDAGIRRIHGEQTIDVGVAHGLLPGVISQMVTDRAGNLWLGTNQGIARVDAASIEATKDNAQRDVAVLLLNQSDGLPALECTSGFHRTALRLNDGRLAFATVGGVAVVDPSRFAEPMPPPPVVVESVTFQGQPARRGEELDREVIGAPIAKIDFAALSYSNPAQTRLRYRLDGLQSDWIESGADRSATYEYLPPGAYRFLIQATRDGREWTEASVAFRVLAPWWKTGPALAFGVIVSLGVVAGGARIVTRRRMQRRLREIEQKLALEKERTRIARDIHDQLGAHLTHITLLSSPSDNAVEDDARERLHAIAATSNELIQSVDAIVWAVNPRHGSLESLARYLSRFAADFLGPAGLRLRLDVPLDLPDAQLSPELRHNVYLACREVLNNVVRHAHATEVTLRLHGSDEAVSIEVADDGCGFREDPLAAGEGLENIRQRLKENAGRCEIASAPGQGTRVRFTIPLKPS